MFNECASLTSLPKISKWNIKNVANADNMFKGCNDTLHIPSKYKNFNKDGDCIIF